MLIYNWHKICTLSSGTVKVLSQQECLSTKDQINNFNTHVCSKNIVWSWWPKPSPICQTGSLISPWGLRKYNAPASEVSPSSQFSEFRRKDSPLQPIVLKAKPVAKTFHSRTIHLMTIISISEMFSTLHITPKGKVPWSKAYLQNYREEPFFQIFVPTVHIANHNI